MLEQGQIIFGNIVNIALENSTNLWKYDIWEYFNTGLVQNLGHINVFLELWAQLFKDNLGTRRLAIKLKGTQITNSIMILVKITPLNRTNLLNSI